MLKWQKLGSDNLNLKWNWDSSEWVILRTSDPTLVSDYGNPEQKCRHMKICQHYPWPAHANYQQLGVNNYNVQHWPENYLIFFLGAGRGESACLVLGDNANWYSASHLDTRDHLCIIGVKKVLVWKLWTDIYKSFLYLPGSARKKEWNQWN